MHRTASTTKNYPSPKCSAKVEKSYPSWMQPYESPQLHHIEQIVQMSPFKPQDCEKWYLAAVLSSSWGSFNAVLLFNHWGGEGKESWLAVFAPARGINAPTVAKFRLPTWATEHKAIKRRDSWLCESVGLGYTVIGNWGNICKTSFYIWILGRGFPMFRWPPSQGSLLIYCLWSHFYQKLL